MKDTTLVIMAAGIGSRFGGGIKQLEPVGPNGEIIMDYSIFDALEAGFNKIVFVIRKDIEEDFREIIGNRIEKVCKVEYAFQSVDHVPSGCKAPAERVKPWGTGQAILCCKGLINEPFAVINADDYYGKEAYVKVHDYLVNSVSESSAGNYCMAGFILKNTLSDNGGVTRGVCVVDNKKHLIGVNETHNILKVVDESGVHAIVTKEDGTREEIDADSYVSMNMWGFQPEFVDTLEAGFREFINALKPGDVKSEYLLPIIVDDMMKKGTCEVTLLESVDKWFGVTYKEDKGVVVDAFKQLIADGVYEERLYK